MTTDLYDPETALSSYFRTRDERATARHWAKEKHLHDLAEVGAVAFFEGGEDNPTVISGFSTSKLWLKQNPGVQSVVGTIRAYDGVGATNLLASWPELTPDLFVDYLSNVAGGSALTPELGTYTPAGDDAVLRTIRARLRDSVSVKDFGATGDGVTDDTETITAAIDAVYAAGGGAVFFPRGTYLVSDIDADDVAVLVKTGVELVGAGKYASTIKLADDENDVRVIKFAADHSYMGIRHIGVDGNRAEQGTPTSDLKGIVGGNNTTSVTVLDVLVKNIYERQIVTNEDSVSGEEPAIDWQILGCTLVGGGGKAIQFRAATHSRAVGNRIETDAVLADASGVEASVSSHIAMVGNVIKHTVSTFGPGLRVVNNSSYVTIQGNTVEGGRQGVIIIDSSHVAVEGNVLRDSSTGIAVQAADVDSNGWDIARNILIKGNVVIRPTTDGLVTSVTDNGLSVFDLVVEGNIFYDDTAVMLRGIRNAGVSNGNGGEIRAYQSNNVIVGATSSDISGTWLPLGQNGFTNRVTITDDQIATITVPNGTDTGILHYVVDTVPTWSGAISYRVTSSLACIELYGDSANRVDQTTGALVAGGGTDSNITFSATSSGTIIISNRAGATRTIAYRFDCCV